MNPMLYFFVALTSVLAATTANAAEPIIDMDGDIVSDGSYYIVPAAYYEGLTLASRGDRPCPLDIVLASSADEKAIPVRFSNWKSRVGFVPQLEDLNIKLDIPDTTCGNSTYWWLDGFRVVAGPKPEGFGIDSFESFFQIVNRRYPSFNVYLIIFVLKEINPPSRKVSEPEDEEPIPIEILVDENGVRRLALYGGHEFEVMFKKANVTEGLSKPMPM